MKNLIITVVLIFIAITSVYSQTLRSIYQEEKSPSLFNTNKKANNLLSLNSSSNNLSKFSIALSTLLFIPEDRKLRFPYSVGYGFNLNLSYKLMEDIKISGNIETIFSDFKMEDMFYGLKYETKSLWLSAEIGTKLYLNRGSSRIFLNTHFKYTQIYHGNGSFNIGLTKNPENTLGFNFGFGVEIPISNQLNIEINPAYNILYPIGNKQLLNSVSAYYRISIGLNHNFKI